MAVFTAAAIAGLLGVAETSFIAVATAGALNLALGVGVELAITSLTPKPDQPKFSIQGKLQAGEDTPRTVPVGYTATAGSLTYGNTWGEAGGTKNAYLTQVIALADVPISGLAGMWVGEQKVTLPDMSGTAPTDQGWPIVEYRGKNGHDHLWLRFYDGTQTAADSFLVNKVSSADRPYESTRVGCGVAYAIVTARVAESLFTGLPSFRFELNGAKLYDITKDGSAGGTGSHRWNDPSTWGGDGDKLPAVQIYNILRGVTYGSQWLYGAQNMPEARLPRADWIAAINACRATVDIGDDETEASYRAGTEIRVSTGGLDTIKLLQDACLGHLAELGGVYTLHVGEPADASFSITDDDILSTEEQIFTPFFGLADTINGITAKYPSPADAWNSKDAPPLYSADYEAEDGNRRLLSDPSLDAVPYDAQVQRIMKAALAEARRARRHTFVLPPKFWRYAVPNVVFSYTSVRNGYTTKLFRIDGAGDKANLDNTVNVTEVDPTDFAWNHATDFTPVAEGSLGDPAVPAQEFVGWSAYATTIQDADGNDRRPAIGIEYPGQMEDVQFVRVQVRLAGATALQFDGTVPYGDPATNDAEENAVISFASILPATDYESRGILVPYSGRDVLWSNETESGGAITEGAWLAVTTEDIRLGSDDIYPIDVDGLAEDVRDLDNWISGDTRALIESLQEQALLVANLDAGSFADRQVIRQSLASAYGDLTANYKSEILVATGPSSALAQRLSALEIGIKGVAAIAITDALAARVTTNEGDIDSIAGQLLTINTTLAGKADTSITDALDSRITTNEGNITANTSALTSLTATVDGKADASAVTALSATVASQGDQLTTNSTAITSVQTSVGDATGSGTFRIQTGFTPATGWDTRIGLQARVDTSNSYFSAGLFLEATSTESRIVMVANRVIITDGTNIAALFDGNTTYIANARIRNLNADNIDVATLTATTGFFDYLVVQDGQIAANAVTNTENTSFSGAMVVDNDWHTVASMTIDSPSGNPLLLFYDWSAVISKPVPVGGGGITVSARITVDGTQVDISSDSETAGSGTVTASTAKNLVRLYAVASGSHTVAIQTKIVDGGVTNATNSCVAHIVAQVNKV